VQDIGFTAL